MSDTFSINDLIRRFQCADELEFRTLYQGRGFPRPRGAGRHARWSRAAVEAWEADVKARFVATAVPPTLDPGFDGDLDLSALPAFSLSDFSI
jgi:hypothetical protein